MSSPFLQYEQFPYSGLIQASWRWARRSLQRRLSHLNTENVGTAAADYARRHAKPSSPSVRGVTSNRSAKYSSECRGHPPPFSRTAPNFGGRAELA